MPFIAVQNNIVVGVFETQAKANSFAAGDPDINAINGNVSDANIDIGWYYVSDDNKAYEFKPETASEKRIIEWNERLYFAWQNGRKDILDYWKYINSGGDATNKAVTRWAYHCMALGKLVGGNHTLTSQLNTIAKKNAVITHFEGILSNAQRFFWLADGMTETNRNNWANLAIASGSRIHCDGLTTAGAIRNSDGTFTQFTSTIPADFGIDKPDLTAR